MESSTTSVKAEVKTESLEVLAAELMAVGSTENHGEIVSPAIKSEYESRDMRNVHNAIKEETFQYRIHPNIHVIGKKKISSRPDFSPAINRNEVDKVINGDIKLNSPCVVRLDQLKIYECDTCNKIFSNKLQFRRHLALCGTVKTIKKPKKKDEEMLFRCDQCGTTFTYLHNLNRHYRVFHDKVPLYTKMFKCDICFKEYKSKFYVVEHKASVHSNHKFECKFCKRLYKCAKYLHEHVKQFHTNSRQFKCDGCSKSFRFKSKLIEHLEGVYSGKTHRCLVCHRPFFALKNLLAHGKNVHKVDLTNDIPMKFKRRSRQFEKKDKRKDETVVDWTTRYKCDMCGALFDEKLSRDDHIRLSECFSVKEEFEFSEIKFENM